jgi:hypothetical protein
MKEMRFRLGCHKSYSDLYYENLRNKSRTKRVYIQPILKLELMPGIFIDISSINFGVQFSRIEYNSGKLLTL